MLWTAQPCGCAFDSVMGRKRPRKCEHGNLFLSEKAASTVGRRPAPMKRGRGFAASPAQQRKVKGRPCIVCGLDGYEAQIHAAHVYPRRLQSCECAEGVVPLCSEHHHLYDDQSEPFDLLRHLVQGYHVELVHAIAVHHVPIRELLDQVTGAKWEPREAVAA